MNMFNEPHRLNRFIELECVRATTTSKERSERIRQQVASAINGVLPKRKYYVRANRTD